MRAGEKHVDARTRSPGAERAAESLGREALTPSDRRRVDELAQIDRRVRAHEAAHQAAAGSMGGAVSFTYETGPDGKSYAVGGEVPVDLSSGRTPEETIARAQQVRAAALAPMDPSPQDRAVAAQASQIEAMARTQLAQEQLGTLADHSDGSAASAATEHDAPSTGGSSMADSSSTVEKGPGRQTATDAANASALRRDVGLQALAVVATVQAERSGGAGDAHTRHIARLAAAAYRR